MFRTYTHNNYVEMLVNFGLTGFVIYYLGYVLNFIKIIKMKRDVNFSMKVLFFVLMSVIFIADIGTVTYYERYVCIILSTISAYFANNVAYREEINEKNKGDSCE